jgi:N-methylhydantoinase A
MAKANEIVVGVDVGGTFTDLIVLDSATGEVRVAKVPTTVENQAFGVMAAIKAGDIALPAVGSIVHGTTTTTNAVLENKVAKAGLITTRGFRDVLELGRRTRPKPYGLIGEFQPVIPRELRLEVPERMDATGNVITPLDETAVIEAMKTLQAAGCEALVVHFLHAYRNPAHELRVVELAKQHWPNGYVTAGHMILSEYREYERGVTAAVNAVVQPVLHRYIDRLSGELAKGGYARDLLVMQGNGGSVSADVVSETAVQTVMSGPASGVMAAAATARAAGVDRVITYDMGGTSSDVGVVIDGVPQVTSDMELKYAMPIHVPMVDVHTIGAGGGSIAWIDEAGMLRVGPHSAGAKPGPVCYGRGGTLPTLTDANLALGRLDPAALLSVDNPVTIEDVRGAIQREVGDPLGLGVDEAASAILRVGNDLMAGAVRMVSLSRGRDPRDFALFAFGGAGPMHAAALAKELSIPKVFLPARPGITNALGCIAADLRHDFVNTLNTPLAALDIEVARSLVREQVASGRAAIERDNVPVEEVEFLYSADMQFQGQTHVLSIPLKGADFTLEELRDTFSEVYFERFAVELPEIRPVLVNLHTAAIGRRKPVPMEALAPKGDAMDLAGATVGSRKVWFAEGGWQDTPVAERKRLSPGATFTGPAIVTQMDCTSVIEPGDRASVDAVGNIILEVAL